MRIECKYDEMMPLKEVEKRWHPDNENAHPEEQIRALAKVIAKIGVRHAIHISKRSGKIAGGHGRLLAFTKLGYDEVPIIWENFEDELEEVNYRASDNIGQYAEFNNQEYVLNLEKVGVDIHEVDLEEFGLINFTPEIEVLEPEGDPDAVPEIKEDPITKRGDIWLLGNHRLMCGDSTDQENIKKILNGESADLVLTDPPYNQETKGGCKGSIGKALRKQGADIEFICDFEPEEFLNALPTVFEKNMNSYIFCNKDLVPQYLNWAQEAGYSFNILIWKKPNAIPIGGSHRPDIEYLLVFRKSAIFNGGLKDVNYSKCIEHGRETGLHPTMKPVSILENQLKIASSNRSIVVDFFLGSGSTLIACEKTNRKCYGMELDEKYCDVIIERYRRYVGTSDKIFLESSEGNIPYEEVFKMREGKAK